MAGNRIDELFSDGLSEEITDTSLVAQGRVVRFEKLRVRLPNGASSDRDIVRHPGGCVVVPIDEEGYAYLVRQYRVAIERITLEFPAGKLEPGEPPLECARRELLEETGLTAGTIRHVTSIYTSPGFCDEVIHVFLATDLEDGEAVPDEDEFVKVVMLPLEELVNLVMAGEIRDAKTVAGALIADRERRGDAADAEGATDSSDTPDVPDEEGATS